MSRNFNRYFIKDDIQMVNKFKKKYIILLVIRKI